MRATLGAPTLLLVPTELELARLADLGGFPAGTGLVATVGFGPIAAAARTSALIARLSPARVVLLGIAGSYDLAAFPIGTALQFDAVAIEGIGVGEGEHLLGPPKLGFPQWPGESASRAIHDRVELVPIMTARGTARPAPLLLTTCAASASREHAARRREHFPDAAAEDMEGFGVALACALGSVPLTIVRGISNAVGDRDPAHWRIPAALSAAREFTLALLGA
jgi:futalosine hydrolase